MVGVTEPKALRLGRYSLLRNRCSNLATHASLDVDFIMRRQPEADVLFISRQKHRRIRLSLVFNRRTFSLVATLIGARMTKISQPSIAFSKHLSTMLSKEEVTPSTITNASVEDTFDDSELNYFGEKETPFLDAMLGTMATTGIGSIGLVATTGIGGALFGVGAIVGLGIGIAINHSALFGEGD